jgi:prophage regulatory protein
MKLLSFEELRPVKGVSYSREQLRRKVNAGTFPKPISLSDHKIAWVETEIDAFLEGLVAQRDGGAK